MSQTNVFGEPIDECCSHPMTGYFRDGFCRTSKYDMGSHTVCALITDAFLVFSQSSILFSYIVSIQLAQ